MAHRQTLRLRFYGIALVTTARKHPRMYMTVVFRPHPPIVNLMNRSATLFLMVSWLVSHAQRWGSVNHPSHLSRKQGCNEISSSLKLTSCPAAESFRFKSPMTSETCGLGLLIPHEGKLGVNP